MHPIRDRYIIKKAGIFLVLIMGVGCRHNETKKSAVHESNHPLVQLAMDKDCSETFGRTFLRVSTEHISQESLTYMNFRQEPYLSHGISIVTDTDTLRPMATMLEKGFNMSDELIYICAFDCKKLKQMKDGMFVFANFLDIGDTLRIPLK